jgi:hypothetical protein
MGRETWSQIAALMVWIFGACAEDAKPELAEKQASGAAGATAGKTKSNMAAIPENMRPERILPELEAHVLAPDVSNGGAALFTDIVTVPTGSDMMFCTYVDFIAKEKLYLHDTKAVQSRFGHHAILQYAVSPQPPGTHECPAGSLEQQQSQIIGGMGEGANIQYPPNVVSEIPAGAQLMINHHWVNVSESDAEVQAEIVTVPPDKSMLDKLVIARTMVVQSTMFKVGPGETGKASAECQFDSDAQLISALGHMHEWGKHVKGERVGSQPDVLFDYDFDPIEAIHPRVNYYKLEEPYRIKAGDSLRVSCEWDNTTKKPLTFPGEMCVISTWQIGADKDRLCFDGKWQ